MTSYCCPSITLTSRAVRLNPSRLQKFDLEPHLCHMADTPSPQPPGLEDLESLVLEVFARVWGEFKAADTEYCETIIGSLATTSPAKDETPATESNSAAMTSLGVGHPGSHVSGVATSTTPRVCIETDIPTLALPPAVEPYPEYESWTPTNRSIFRGDDSDNMPFLPYADEPAFNKRAYCKFFKTLAWQGGQRVDADRKPSLIGLSSTYSLNFVWVVVESIVLEAAHRLYFDYGIELARIDEANVLPFTLVGDLGFIHNASQR